MTSGQNVSSMTQMKELKAVVSDLANNLRDHQNRIAFLEKKLTGIIKARPDTVCVEHGCWQTKRVKRM